MPKASCAKCMHVYLHFYFEGRDFWRKWNSFKLPMCLYFVVRWDEWGQLPLVGEFMSNVLGKWSSINDCIYSRWCFICLLFTLTPLCCPPHPQVSLLIQLSTMLTKNKQEHIKLKHIKTMSSLVSQVTQLIFNSPFSMKDIHTNPNQYNWFPHLILWFFPIELKINLISTKSWL